MGDEGGGVDVAIISLSPVYLKHLGFQHAARRVADTGNTESENGQDAPQAGGKAPPTSQNRRCLP
ncbi:MAG: hypothetical protein IPL99_24070 [Candidatus Competibacteraceae bacterium]|nr:hypothetical protein [Candidatus Competibacteraceae bacterium]